MHMYDKSRKPPEFDEPSVERQRNQACLLKKQGGSPKWGLNEPVQTAFAEGWGERRSLLQLLRCLLVFLEVGKKRLSVVSQLK